VDLIQATMNLGKRVWVDTSGTALQSVSKMKDVIIKVNGEEAGAIVGITVTDPPSALRAAEEMRRMGPETVILTLGAEGAIIVQEEGRWWAKSPPIRAVDVVGSGDSFLAGLVVAARKDLSPDRALQYAVAAGAANATMIGGGDFPISTFHQILEKTELHPL
jgi:tagatose 6-phosphate kinase